MKKMNFKIALAGLLVTLIYSCTFKKENKNAERSAVQINAKYPFGCDVLEKYRSLHGLSLVKDPEAVDNASIKCFNTLNTRRQIETLAPRKIDIIKLRSEISFNDSLFKFSGKIIYRLPNIGPYQCYYSYRDITQYPNARTYEEE